MTEQDVREDVLTKYVEEKRGYETPCWIWQGAVRNGYGRLMLGGRYVVAPRVFYEWHREPIADGHEIDHLCSQPICVNPDHLEPVTHIENTRRGRNSKVTSEQVAEIRASNESSHQLASCYGLAVRTIQALRKGTRGGVLT